MTAPSSFVRGFGTAYKRARSHDSSTPLASPPVLKATKIEEGEEATEDDTEVPAFLRQSQAGMRPFRAYASVHHAACLDRPLSLSSYPD